MLTRKEKKQLLRQAKVSQDGEYGIETLVKIQLWKAETIEEVIEIVKRAKKGQKPIFYAITKLWNNAVDLFGLISDNKKIAQEYQDLSEEERLKVDKAFRDALKLEDQSETTEEFIERTDGLARHIAEYVQWTIKNMV